jgi:sulfite exporter TauE/SafE
VSAGGAGQGAMVAVAFGASTLPALSTLVIGVRTVVDRSVWTRRAIALAVLVCGLTSVGLRWSPLSDEAAPCHIQPEFAL